MSLDLGAIRLQDLTKQQLTDAKAKDFCLWLALLGQTRDRTLASEWYAERYPRSFGMPYIKKDLDLAKTDPALVTKAVSSPATTTDLAYAGSLVGIDMLATGFLEQVYSASLLGRIPGVVRAPFNVTVPYQNGAANYAWIGEQGGKPVSQLSFNTGATLTRTKAAAILVFTSEFVRSITAATADSLRRAIISGVTAFTDKSFLDPTSGAIANTRPASITNGRTPTASTGNYQTDVQSLLTAFFTQRPGASPDTVLIANAAHAAQIRSWNSGGGVGLPVLATEAAGAITVVVDGQGLVIADDGIEIDTATQAALEMADPATSPPDATVVIRSLFQDNLIGYRVERFVSWFAAPTSVAYLAA